MARARAVFASAPRCSSTVSAIWSPIVIVGFSDVIGSWKIIPTSLPRTCRIPSSLSDEITWSPRLILPPTMCPPGGRSCMIESAVIVLPEPDSPTMPRHSPASRLRLTPSSACTVALRSRISVRRSSIDSSGAMCPREFHDLSSSSGPDGRGPGGGCRPVTAARLAALQPDLDGVAQPLADEDGRGDHDDDAESGRDDQPPVAVVDVLDAVGEHPAPVGLRRTDAESQVTERHD